MRRPSPFDRGRAVLLVLAVALQAGCVAPQTRGVPVDPAAAAREEQIQRDMRLERRYKQQVRLLDVSRPVLKGAVTICKEDVRPSTGLMYATLSDFGKDDVGAANRYGVRDQATVIGVVKDGPASRVDLRRGDVITAVNGTPTPKGSKATPKTAELMTNSAKVDPHVVLRIERAGAPLELGVDAETLCSYPVVLVQDENVNAYADGKAIYITTGMMRFVETDQELATVIAHEMAHNAMDHMQAQAVNRAIGTIFDIIAAAYGVDTQGAFGNATGLVYSKEFEAEADYVGLYALALSGVDIHGVADFWRRMGSELGGIKTQYGSTHPGSTDRYLALETAVAEIDQKVVDMQPLVPNMKTNPKPK